VAGAAVPSVVRVLAGGERPLCQYS